MGFSKTSIIAIVVSLAVLLGEFFLVFPGDSKPLEALLGMFLGLVNGLVIAFALLLLLIGILLLSN